MSNTVTFFEELTAEPKQKKVTVKFPKGCITVVFGAACIFFAAGVAAVGGAIAGIVWLIARFIEAIKG